MAEATVAHLLRLSSWSGLRLELASDGVELLVSTEDSEKPLLSWTGEVGFSFTTLALATTAPGAWIGIHVSSSDCVSERVWASPARFWTVEPHSQSHDQYGTMSALDIYLLGSGEAKIDFFTFPEDPPIFSILVRSHDFLEVSLVRTLDEKTLNHTREENVNKNDWVHLKVGYTESFFLLEMGFRAVLEYVFAELIILIYWISLSVTTGVFNWSLNCKPLGLSDAVTDGGWSAWSDWQCSVSCGRGEGKRHRMCNNPPPTMTGKYCMGAAVHQGVCNDFPCGDISPYLVKKIRSELASRGVSEEVDSGQSLKIHCNLNLAQEISNATKNCSFSWSINGFLPDESRTVQDQFGSLVITNASLKDTGVWLCSTSWSVGETIKSVAIRVVALAVLSKLSTMTVRRGQTLRMPCNADTLTHLYGDLSAKWTINDTTWINHAAAGANDMEDYLNGLIFAWAEENTVGVWKCVVFQEKLRLKWTTAWVRVEVLPPSSFWTHLMEDDLTAPLFGGISEGIVRFVFFLLIFVILLIPLIFLVITIYL